MADNKEFVGTFLEGDARLRGYRNNPSIYKVTKSLTSGNRVYYNVYKYKR